MVRPGAQQSLHRATIEVEGAEIQVSMITRSHRPRSLDGSAPGLIRNDDGSRFIGSPFNGPFSSTRNRFTPAMQFLIHPNIKATVEYQFRPSQSVVIATNPLDPFHTNTLVLGLTFAY